MGEKMKKEISRTCALVDKQNRNNYFRHRIFLSANFVKQIKVYYKTKK